MIRRRTVVVLGISQLVCWGLSYYLIGVFGERIASDTGWSRPFVYGGFSLALAVMGLASPLVGRTIDRQGGRAVMAAGSGLMAAGCAVLALATSRAVYLCGWMVLGVAMRMTLYDAAFAVLARIGGASARRAMAEITLAGGLASTVVWPLGEWLITMFGWRSALWAYAALALLTLPLHLGLEEAPATDTRPVGRGPHADSAPRSSAPTRAAVLYAATTAVVQFLNAGMSSHMIAILVGLGLGAGAAVAAAALRGAGQTASRLGDVLFGATRSPLALNAWAAGLILFAFVAGLAGAASWPAAALFAATYGAGNGLATIARGSLPLLLFDPRSYGHATGRWLAPSFVAAAAAPAIYAQVIDRLGPDAALQMSAGLAAVAVAMAVGLRAALRPLPGQANILPTAVDSEPPPATTV